MAAVGGEAGTTGKAHRVAVVPTNGFIGQGQRRCFADTPLDGRHILDDLPSNEAIASLHGVTQPDLHGVEPTRRREAIHLALVGEACLHHTEPAHRAARQVVGTHRIAVDHGIGTLVWALRMGYGVDEHCRRRGCVRPTVEKEACFDLHDAAIVGGVVSHPDTRRVAVHMPEETLFTAVGDAHRAPCAER